MSMPAVHFGLLKVLTLLLPAATSFLTVRWRSAIVTALGA
jgi:hypothetical protein